MWTRRSFLTTGAAALAGATLPMRSARADAYRTFANQSPTGSPELKALVARALESARSAGATYADVQVRTARSERWSLFGRSWGHYPFPWEWYYGGIGVRALIDGYWGFSGLNGVATADIMATLGRTAAAQARIAAGGQPRSVVLAPTPVINDGHWTTPIEIDPFTVSADEKIDFCETLSARIDPQRYRNALTMDLNFIKDERTFASTDGTYLSQIVYTTGGGNCGVSIERSVTNEREGGGAFDCLTPAGAGWEYVRQSPLLELLPAVVEQAHDLQRRPLKPVEADRYDIVCDATTVARLLDATIGVATELDRAMGYEVNGVGTSFLDDPLGMAGNYKVGSPLVTVTADRSMPRGAATAQWDDEGVPTGETTLVREGILTDFQTTREAASWLAPYYQRRNMTVRSNGCAGAERVTDAVTQTPPNFVLAPGSQTASFEQLVRNTKRGLAVMGAYCEFDHQVLNGSCTGGVIEIKDGQLGAIVQNALCLIRTPEFWRNVTAIGGRESAQRVGLARSRGRGRIGLPALLHTVAAVPMAVTGVAVVDRFRRV